MKRSVYIMVLWCIILIEISVILWLAFSNRVENYSTSRSKRILHKIKTEENDEDDQFFTPLRKKHMRKKRKTGIDNLAEMLDDRKMATHNTATQLIRHLHNSN